MHSYVHQLERQHENRQCIKKRQKHKQNKTIKKNKTKTNKQTNKQTKNTFQNSEIHETDDLELVINTLD